MRERVVERYLTSEVERHGGMCEKFVSPGKNKVPDRIVTWGPPALIDFVETKAPTKDADAGQKRDHERRRARGVQVFVLNTCEKVDQYIERRRTFWSKQP